MLVQIRNLQKHYLEGAECRAVLSGLDMDIAQGEAVALLGSSGSGKSTLLNLISGIDLPDFGEVVINGARVSNYGERARTLFRRQYIGFVFQFYNLIPTLNVLENILLPLELAGKTDSAHRQHADDLLGRIGLADRCDSYPEHLSGGEQQRIAILRALIHQPLLLLADEPTGNLDEETGQLIMALFKELVHETGMTMVLVTHSKDVVQIADRVLLLRGGHITPMSS